MGVAREFWKVLTPAQRRWVLAAQVGSVLVALSTVAGVAAISPFFAVLADPGLVDRSQLLRWLYVELGFHGTRSFLTALGLGFIGVVLLSNLLNLVGSYALLRLALWIGDDLRRVLFSGYLHRSLLFHATANSNALYNNITQETSRVIYGILQNLFLLGTNLVTATLILLSILLVSPLSAIAVITGLGGGYFLIYAAVQRRILRSGQVESELAAERTQLILEALGAIKEVIVLGRQEFFQKRFERASSALSRVAAYIDMVTHTPRHVMECIAVSGLVGAALVLSSAGGGVGQSLARLSFLGFAVYRLLPALQQTFAALVKIRASRGAFDAISGDLVAARAAPKAPSPPNGAWHNMPLREICLTDVTFRYRAQSAPALQDVSLRIPAGTLVGLVGSNGSGKTTLVDVLAGLLAPDSGRVEVDGVPLDEITRPAWQSRIAYVPQGIFLLDSTLAQNIALGIAAEGIDRERVVKAARLARLDDVVAALPKGFDERIGERGIRLSGGQRQRIGIARALYTDAAVLIMDEATNAMDVFAEEEVMASVEALRGNRTIILIAHRLNTLRRCDVIFELESGSIARSGTWNDLMRRSKQFAVAGTENTPARV
jgi:ABC-type multidrug transport system fused ATPase/permease subunit